MLPLNKFKNNLDPGQATMVVFPDTMYTFRNTQGKGGGSKLITFSHSQLFSQQKIACTNPEGGARGPDPPGKHKLYRIQ